MQVLRTLQAKTFFVVAGLVVAIGGCAFGLQAYSDRQYALTMTQALNAPLATTIAAELAASRDATDDLAVRAKPTFSRLMSINPSIEIYLLSGSGGILAFTAPVEEVRRTKVDLAPVKAFIANEFVYPIFGDNPKDPTSRKIFSAARLDRTPEDAGYVYVILGGAEFDAVAARIESGILARSGAALAIGGSVAGLAAMLYFRAAVIAKLRRLIAAIDEFAGSGFRKATTAVDIGGDLGDEIDAVSRAFRDMAAHIQMLLGKLEDIDRSRRELITNVSHDLRAPIASARAHLETLVVKQTVLSAEQRADHLEIATKQIRRLARLAEELFELGKLEAPNARATMERFPVAELMQDVIQKFQIEARARQIELKGDLGADMPQLSGDIALIERVLDNLIENAIRHTPPDGHVTVAAASRNESVVITVADSGEGIEPEHLKHVFERFYRVRQHGGHDNGGSGLGLAIVRRIVEMHGGVVSAASEPGQGSRFSVVLPVDARGRDG